MSDKLFPGEKNEYEYEEEDKNVFKEFLKGLIDRVEAKFSSQNAGRDEVEEGFKTGRSSGKVQASSSTGFEIERSEGNRRFFEKAGLPTYTVIWVEIILVSYFILALLGFVPMF